MTKRSPWISAPVSLKTRGMMTVAAVQPDPQLPVDAAAHVGTVVTSSGSSFYWAMRILPRERRQAIFAVYAFCREVDDVADSDAPEDIKIGKLAEWRREIDLLYDGEPSSPIMLALGPALADYGLEKVAFLAIIEGMEMDARGPIRAPALAELEAYCGRVASAVGSLCIRIFGETGADGRIVAGALGLALQYTNILRDVREDAEMGRLYLPKELLEANGIHSTEPDDVLHHENLSAVCGELAVLADGQFATAGAAIARCDRRAMRPAIIMMKVYQWTLSRMQRRGWKDVPGYRRGALARAFERAGKILIALRYGLV